MKRKLAKWFFFSILVGLLPIVSSYIKAVSVGPPTTLKDVVSRGGLLLVATGLSAVAIGELMAAGREREMLKYLAGGPCLLVVASACLYYPVVSDAYTLALKSDQSLETLLNVDFAFWFSLIAYATAIYGSLVGVWVADIESRNREPARQVKESSNRKRE